jgi:hypothetical protein
VTSCAGDWEIQQEEATMTTKVLREAVTRENVENWVGIVLAFGSFTLALAMPAIINHMASYPLLIVH